MVSLLTLMALKSSSDSERPLGVIIVFSINKTVTEEQQSLKGSWKIPPCRRPDQFAQYHLAVTKTIALDLSMKSLPRTNQVLLFPLSLTNSCEH